MRCARCLPASLYSFSSSLRNRLKRTNKTSGASAFFATTLALALLGGTETANAQRPIGVDVSSYQGSSINWTSVKGDGVAFAWAKATEGVSINDSTFSGNISRGKTAGVYMGAYHFAHPNLNTPAAEANHFWAVAGATILADGKTLMPMLDMEVFSGVVGASSYTQWANNWCADIVAKAAAAGVKVKPAIYVSACNACYFTTSISQWYSDIADYNGGNIYTGTPWTTCTSCEVWGSGVWHFWQVSSTASISGISGNVDLDGYNGTLAGLQSTMLATAANSAIYYWDPQATSGANPYTGNMSGIWENSKWSTSSAGQASPTTWVDGKAACFGVHTGTNTPAYTVTMNADHVVAGFFNGALVPNACDVTITGSGVITLASGAQGFDAHNASDGSLAFIRINNEIAGDGQAVPEDNGQIFFNGTNSYSGGTQLGYFGNAFTGLLNINNDLSLGTGDIVSSNGYGCAIVVQGSLPINITNSFTAAAASNSVNFVANPAGLTFSGPWELQGWMRVGAGGAAANLVTISGPISGAGAYLSKFNPGTLALSGINTYSGHTAIAGGPLVINGAGNLGNGSYAGRITNGSTFVYASTASQTLSGIISGAGSIIQSNAGVLKLTGVNTYSGGTTVAGGAVLAINADSGLGASAGSLTLNGGTLKNNGSAPTIGVARTISLGVSGGFLDAGTGSANPVTVNGKITGVGKLLINLDASPVVLVNPTNDYAGDTIIGTNGPGFAPGGSVAWLKLGASNVIPGGAGKGNVVINQTYGGILDLAGFTEAINGLSGSGIVDNSTGSGSLSVGGNDQSSLFSGTIKNTGGTLTLTKTGIGVLTLAGANTYTGNTAISAGTLALGDGGSIGASAVTVSSAATLANASTNTGSIGGSVTFNSGAAGSFTAIGGNSSVFGKISVAGNLALNANILTVNVAGASLAPGTYRLLECAGALTGLPSPIPNLTGAPLDAGLTAQLNTVGGAGGHVDLVIKASPVIFNLTASPSIVYGAASLVLGGTISAPGPIFPAAGETVSITINGNTQLTTVNDATGDFSLNYNSSAIPASGSPFAINYAYAGDALLNGTNNAETALTVNQRPAILTGTRVYDGTTDAAAAILSLTNVVSGDVVTVASGTATLAGASVGTQAITSTGTLALGGAAAANYTLTGASGSVVITAAGFLITGEYMDGTGTNLVITWQSTPGTTYQVVGYTNVTTAVSNWMTVGGPITATNASTTLAIPLSGNLQVFEVKAQ